MRYKYKAGPRAYDRGLPNMEKWNRIPKTTTRKKRARSAALTAAASSLNALTHTPLLPVSKWGKLPYYDAYFMNIPATTTATAYIIRANSLNDPDFTSSGHQPMGFDQMMLFYEHYCVTKAKITVNFFNASVTESAVVGILIAPDTTVESSVSKLNENGMLVKKWLGPNTGSGNKCTLTLEADIAKINGKKDVTLEDDFRGDAASDPQEMSYFHIFGYNKVTTTGFPLHFEFTIEYTSKFTEPKKMTQS